MHNGYHANNADHIFRAAELVPSWPRLRCSFKQHLISTLPVMQSQHLRMHGSSTTGCTTCCLSSYSIIAHQQGLFLSSRLHSYLTGRALVLWTYQQARAGLCPALQNTDASFPLYAGLGFAGAAAAYSLSTLLEVALLLVLMLYRQVQPLLQHPKAGLCGQGGGSSSRLSGTCARELADCSALQRILCCWQLAAVGKFWAICCGT